MPPLADILSRYTVATQPLLCSPSSPPPSPGSAASPTLTKQRRGFTACPRWVDAAIAARTTNAFLRGLAVRLALLLYDRADNHTGETRTLTYPQLARLLGVSADSVARAVAILRAVGACTTAPVYFQRRRIGLRYTMRHALTKTAGQRSQDLPLRRKSTKGSRAPSAPPAAPAAAPVCPIADTPWLFDAPVMAEKGETCPRCPCHAPQPEVLALEPEPAPVPQRELPLELATSTPPRPSDSQLRLPAYKLLDRQPALSDAELMTAWPQIIAARYPGAPVSAECLVRQLRIVRQRHDPDYAEKQHRRERAARRTTIGRGTVRTYNETCARFYAAPAVSTEERDRRRAADEQLRAEVVAAVEAQPLDAAADLRDVVRPAVDYHLRRCPGLTDHDRPRLEQDAIGVVVLQELRGRSITDTITALIAERRGPRAARCG